MADIELSEPFLRQATDTFFLRLDQVIDEEVSGAERHLWRRWHEVNIIRFPEVVRVSVLVWQAGGLLFQHFAHTIDEERLACALSARDTDEDRCVSLLSFLSDFSSQLTNL